MKSIVVLSLLLTFVAGAFAASSAPPPGNPKDEGSILRQYAPVQQVDVAGVMKNFNVTRFENGTTHVEFDCDPPFEKTCFSYCVEEGSSDEQMPICVRVNDEGGYEIFREYGYNSYIEYSEGGSSGTITVQTQQ